MAQAIPFLGLNTTTMIILQPINTAQRISFISNVAKRDLPIENATFEFFDSYSGMTHTTTANIQLSGFVNIADITIQLTNERKYQLVVKNGTTTIFKDTVTVTAQANTTGTNNERVQSLDDYRNNAPDNFVSFNSVLPESERTKDRRVTFKETQ